MHQLTHVISLPAAPLLASLLWFAGGMLPSGTAAAECPVDAPPPAPLAVVEVGRDSSRVKILADNEATIIDIVSPIGIDKATIRRRQAEWPLRLRIRLHLKGLEHFRVVSGKLSLHLAVASGGLPTSTVQLRRGDQTTPLDADSPYHTTARIIGDNGTIPLQHGYFEIPLPDKLLESNPERIELSWIDFYR